MPNETVEITLEDRIRGRVDQYFSSFNCQSEGTSILESILDGMPDAVFVKRDDTNIILGNPQCGRYINSTGTKKTHTGLALYDITDHHLLQLIECLTDDREMRSELWHEELQIFQFVSIKRFSISLPDQGRGVVVFIRDLTAEEELERQVLESHMRSMEKARFAALGEMAGGIAHEINNPLTIISGRAAQALAKLEMNPDIPGSNFTSAFELIIKHADRISRIVKGLRNCLRTADGVMDAAIDPTELVEDVLGISQERFKIAGVELYTELTPNLRIKGQRVPLSQVLLNLVNNAFDALKEHGVKNPQVNISARSNDGFLELRVWDNGPGVPSSIESKIMEPFFTTKGVGQGTGLGLSISRTIAQDHGGELSLDRSVAASCFLLIIPLSEQLRNVPTSAGGSFCETSTSC